MFVRTRETLSTLKTSLGRSINLFVAISAVITAAVALSSKLPSRLSTPGFSSMVLFEDHTFLLAYVITLCLLGIIWYRRGNSQPVAVFVVAVYTLMVIDVLENLVPMGNFLFSGPGYASVVQGIQQTGRLSYTGWGTYPAMFVIAYSFLSLSGAGIGSTLLTLDYFRAFFFGLMTYLIVSTYVRSPKIASLASMLSVIADAQLVKDPPFNVSTYGFMFFLVAVLLMVRFSGKRPFMVSFELTMAAAVLSYPMIPFMVSLMVLLSIFGLAKRARLEPTSRPQGFFPKSPFYLLIATAVPYVAWTVYVSRYFTALNSLSASLTRFLVGQGFVLGAPSASVGPTYYLQQLLQSNIGSLPYHLGFLLPSWFFVFYGGGTIIWLIAYLMVKGRGGLVQPLFFIPLFLTGVLLFLLPGGAEWPRILVYMGPFTACSFAYLIRARLSARTACIVMAAIIFLTLPTVVVYYQEVGTNLVQYPEAFSAGTFVNTHAPTAEIFAGGGIDSLNLSLNQNLNPLISTVSETPAAANTILAMQLSSWRNSPDSVLVLSPPLYLEYIHLYGKSDAVYAQVMLNAYTQNIDLVYSNRFTSIYAH